MERLRIRAADITHENLFSMVQLQTFAPSDHPLRAARLLFNTAMNRIDWLLGGAYSERGRESIPPERLLRALLLQVLFSNRTNLS